MAAKMQPWNEGGQRHTRRQDIPGEFREQGFGIFERLDTFPAHFRPYLMKQIEKAYNRGDLGKRESERFMIAWRLGLALNDKRRPMLEALRQNMNLDGAELVKAIRSLVPVIPALGELGAGDLASWVEKEVEAGR